MAVTMRTCWPSSLMKSLFIKAAVDSRKCLLCIHYGLTTVCGVVSYCISLNLGFRIEVAN